MEIHNRMHRSILPAALGFALALGALPTVEAQSRPPALPKCEPRRMLVTSSSGQWECATLEELLSARGCSGVLQYTSSDGLKCLRPESSSSVAELLLPTCSSGLLLASEGFGRWRCIERRELMPDCSSNETLVSEGSGRWRCAESLPRCSSGEELESEGSGRWRCRRRN